MSYFSYKTKRVFYKMIGKKNADFPLILLHGNTVSSKLFLPLIGKLKKHHTLILIDFPGHGKSERMNVFYKDFFYENAVCVKALIDELKLERVNILGTSGGAIVGLNLALEYPDVVEKIVADSLVGLESNDSMVEAFVAERKQSMKSLFKKLFWRFCNGRDWRKVVDNDTFMLIEFNREIKMLFHKDIKTIKPKVLFTASKADEFISDAGFFFENLKNGIGKSCSVKIFEKGEHPSMLTSLKEFTNIVIDFLNG